MLDAKHTTKYARDTYKSPQEIWVKNTHTWHGFSLSALGGITIFLASLVCYAQRLSMILDAHQPHLEVMGFECRFHHFIVSLAYVMRYHSQKRSLTNAARCPYLC
jgi:hypothetical protein